MFALLFGITFLLTSVSAQTQCPLPTKADCATLGGVMNGARCFFYKLTAVNWTDAWAECAKDGGTLAQLHTADEYTAVTSMLSTNGVTRAWFAMMRDSSADGAVPCDTMRTMSTWYSEVAAKTNLNAMNTWIRYHICDDNDTQSGEYCYNLLPKSATWSEVGDRGCDVVWTGLDVLCQFNTQEQQYTMTNYCMQETPIESHTGIETFQECADLCTQRMWCRSFNVLPDSVTCKDNTCQLFSMSALDPCPECANRIAGSAGCIHYNYVP